MKKSYAVYWLASIIGVAIAPALAASQNLVNSQIAPSNELCFNREYSAAHLAAHPDQLTTRIGLVLRSNDKATEYPYSFQLGVKLRGKSLAYTSSACSLPKNAAVSGIDIYCFVECDGGGFRATTFDKESKLKVTLAPPDGHGFIVLQSSCDGDKSEAPMLDAGTDDKVFMLDKAPPLACSDIKVEQGSLENWTDDEKIGSSGWSYSEKHQNEVLNQCQVESNIQAQNGTVAKITIAVLSKGTWSIILDDEEWAKRVRMDWGWEEGKELTNVEVRSLGVKEEATAKAISNTEFAVFLKQNRKEKLQQLFGSSDVSIYVGGLTAKNWLLGDFEPALKRLSRCELVLIN